MELDLTPGPILPKKKLADLPAQPKNTVTGFAHPEFSASLFEAPQQVAPEADGPVAPAQMALDPPAQFALTPEVAANETITANHQPAQSEVAIKEVAVKPGSDVPIEPGHGKARAGSDQTSAVTQTIPVITPPSMATDPTTPRPAAPGFVELLSSAPQPQPALDPRPYHVSAAPDISAQNQDLVRLSDPATTRQNVVAALAPAPAADTMPQQLPTQNQPLLPPATQGQANPAQGLPTESGPAHQAQPNIQAGLTTIDGVSSDPLEIQIGLRIEKQSTEGVQLAHAQNKATPTVATQISTQLPQLVTKVEQQTIELRLDPPELGRVTIHLNTQEQQVIAHITADRADTIELMRRHADLLAATLAKAGFSQTNLSFQQGERQHQGNTNEHFQSLASLSESNELTNNPSKTIDLNGRLDIRL